MMVEDRQRAIEPMPFYHLLRTTDELRLCERLFSIVQVFKLNRQRDAIKVKVYPLHMSKALRKGYKPIINNLDNLPIPPNEPMRAYGGLACGRQPCGAIRATCPM
jgi:hypothetical protein